MSGWAAAGRCQDHFVPGAVVVVAAMADRNHDLDELADPCWAENWHWASSTGEFGT